MTQCTKHNRAAMNCWDCAEDSARESIAKMLEEMAEREGSEYAQGALRQAASAVRLSADRALEDLDKAMCSDDCRCRSGGECERGS